MKTVIILVALYELTIGISELLWVSTGSTALASAAALPSVASVVDPLIASSSASGSANSIEGGLDTAIGAGLLLWALKGL